MPQQPDIRVLSETVANKIAAGEVVERPASVLKELMENAIDAGSTQIDVELAAGGRKLVAVSDNGDGLNRDNALLAIERHATSKIRDVDDIEHIGLVGQFHLPEPAGHPDQAVGVLGRAGADDRGSLQPQIVGRGVEVPAVGDHHRV